MASAADILQGLVTAGAGFSGGVLQGLREKKRREMLERQQAMNEFSMISSLVKNNTITPEVGNLLALQTGVADKLGLPITETQTETSLPDYTQAPEFQAPGIPNLATAIAGQQQVSPLRPGTPVEQSLQLQRQRLLGMGVRQPQVESVPAPVVDQPQAESVPAPVADQLPQFREPQLPPAAVGFSREGALGTQLPPAAVGFSREGALDTQPPPAAVGFSREGALGTQPPDQAGVPGLQTPRLGGFSPSVPAARLKVPRLSGIFMAENAAEADRRAAIEQAKEIEKIRSEISLSRQRRESALLDESKRLTEETMRPHKVDTAEATLKSIDALTRLRESQILLNKRKDIAKKDYIEDPSYANLKRLGELSLGQQNALSRELDVLDKKLRLIDFETDPKRLEEKKQIYAADLERREEIRKELENVSRELRDTQGYLKMRKVPPQIATRNLLVTDVWDQIVASTGRPPTGDEIQQAFRIGGEVMDARQILAYKTLRDNVKKHLIKNAGKVDKRTGKVLNIATPGTPEFEQQVSNMIRGNPEFGFLPSNERSK